MIKNSNKKKYAYQASVQLISSFSILILSFLINIVATKNIDTNVFGEYRFVINYLLMIPGLIHFGYANSVGRIAAQSNDEEQSKISGYGLLVTSIFALFYIAISMPIMGILNKSGIINLTWYAVWLTPFILLFTMQKTVQTILTGQNKMISLAIFNLIPQTLLFITIMVQIYVFKYTNTLALLIPYVVINGMAIIYRIYICKPTKVSVSESFSVLKEENKNFGFKVYIGSIFGVIIGQLVGLTSGSFIGMEEYGLFALAFSFVVPFQMLASTLGTVLYRSNVTRKKISYQLFLFVIGLSAVSYLLFYIIIDVWFTRIFSLDYINAIFLVKILALYGIFLGLGDFINRFLGAKGYGKTLMIGAILTGISVLSSALILVPRFQIEGLVFSYIFSGLVYLFSMLAGYVLYLKRSPGVKNSEKF